MAYTIEQPLLAFKQLPVGKQNPYPFLSGHGVTNIPKLPSENGKPKQDVANWTPLVEWIKTHNEWIGPSPYFKELLPDVKWD